MRLRFLFLFLFLTFFEKSAFAQKACGHFLGPSQTQRTLKDIHDFFGQSNSIFVYDSEVSLKNTYKYDPQTQSWSKDPYFYKNRHHEFTLVHLEDIPLIQNFFKLVRAEVQFPGPQNDFSTRLDFNEILNIQRLNPQQSQLNIHSLYDSNILILTYTNKVHPQPDNPNLVMVRTRWVFEKKPDNTLSIFQSDTITQEKQGAIIAGERYDFEIKSTPNNRKPQVESILDLYLKRIDENSYRILYH